MKVEQCLGYSMQLYVADLRSASKTEEKDQSLTLGDEEAVTKEDRLCVLGFFSAQY